MRRDSFRGQTARTTAIRLQLMRQQVIVRMVNFGVVLTAIQLTLAHFFSVAATPPNFSTLGCFLTGICIYAAAIVLPWEVGVFTALLYASLSAFLASYLGQPAVVVAARIALFAFAIALLSNRRIFAPPFIVLAGCWGIYFLFATALLPAVLPVTNEWLLPNVALTPLLVFGETFVVLVLGVSRMYPTLPVVAREIQHPFPLAHCLSEIAALVIFSCIAVFGLVLVHASRESLTFLASELPHYRSEAFIVVSLLFLAPIAIGLYAASALGAYLRNLRLLTIPSSKLHTLSQAPVPVQELQEVLRQIRTATERSEAEARKAQHQYQELARTLDEQRMEVRRRELLVDQARAVLNASSWGCFTISAEGTVLSANEVLGRLLSISPSAIIGKHFSELRSKHPWMEEIATTMSLLCRDEEFFQQREHRRYSSSSYGGSYLDIVVSPVASGNSELPEQTVSNEEEGSAEQSFPADKDLVTAPAVAVFIYRRHDLRGFDYQLLRPKSTELIGTIALDACREIRDQIAGIVKHLTKTTARLFASSSAENLTPASEMNDEELESVVLLKNVERNLQQSLETLDACLDEAGGFPAKVSRVNLSELLRSVAARLAELGNEEFSIPVTNISDRTAPRGSSTMRSATYEDIEAELHPAPVEDVIITTSRNELNILMIYFAALLRSLSEQSPELEVSVGPETIGAGTASIIPGSQPGRFARIVVMHPIQTINTTLVGARAGQLQTIDEPQTQLELALTFLAAQTKRLGGFITLQTSSSKGTTITVYIPIERGRPIEKQPRKRPTASMQITSPGTAPVPEEHNILLVGDNVSFLEGLRTMLKDLGYPSNVRDTQHVLKRNQSEMDFSGSGFDLSDSSPKSTEESGTLAFSEEETNTPYDVLIFNAESMTSESIYLLQQIQRQYPQATTLIITETAAAEAAFETNCATLSRPFNLSMLRGAVERLLR